MKPPAFLFALLAAFSSSACVSGGLTRTQNQTPTLEEDVETLVLGESDLSSCLRILGAPNIVQEYRVHSVVLAYRWVDQFQWGFSVSYSFSEYAPSASFAYDDQTRDVPGVVLFFDEDLVLETIRKGNLGALLPIDLAQPATIEQIEEG